ncbi:MAG: hypothetical protein QNJ92_15665 [Alphaproteobacteria bacterium]|nr:hypothetical protein [Alphaproteobacteria bacterium]
MTARLLGRLGLMLALTFVLPAAQALAQQYDDAAPRDASQLLSDEERQSPAHQVADTVPLYAHTYFFTLQTNWGPMTAFGRDMLTIRLRETYALQRLEEISSSEAFADAVKKSARAPLEGAKNLLTNPADTVANVPRGMRSFLGRIGQAANGQKESDDSLVETLGGTARAKRELAAQFGVSPYSSNRALQAELNRITNAASFGGLSMSAATFAMPGAIGLTFSAGRLNQDIAGLLRDKTPQELREANRMTLRELDISNDVIESFLANAAYTPHTETILVQSLGALRGATQIGSFVILATAADDEDDAFVYQRIAQMMAGYSNNVERVTQLGVIDNLPVAATDSRKVLVFFPADKVIWTERSEERTDVVDRIVESLQPDKKELWIAGRFSSLAKQELTARGWVLSEGARGTLYDVF